MSDFSMVSPLLDGMREEAQLSSHDGVSVHRLLHTASGIRCIVKHISIPESKVDTEALYLTGAVKDQEDTVRYYQSVVDQYRKELSALRALSAGPGFCSYARFQVVAKTDQPGFDLYLLAPCRTSLLSYLENNAITQKMAVQLGVDLSRALAVLRERGYVHLDLKPENVFLERGKFCIGDFGLTPVSDLRYGTLPARFLSSYTAPEACGVTSSLNETTDLYAVGLLLYYIYNGNHVPFEEAGTTEKTADSRRISGEDLPAPLYADYEMDAIIRKACAFRPEDRYQTPAELLEALESYASRNQLSDECIVPPLVLDDAPLSPEPEEPGEEEAEPVSFTDAGALSETFKESFTPAQEDASKEQKKRKRAKWVPVVLALLVVLAGVLAYLYFVYTAVTITKISITDKGTDFLTVSVAASDYAHLAVTCTPDGEGTAVTYRCEESVTFRDLQPATLYHISVDATDWHYVKGTQGGTAETSAITEVLSLTAEDLQNGSAQVTFQVSGPEPEAWTLRCSGAAAGDTTYESTDHSFTLDGLLPNSQYTLTLEAGDGYHLGGTVSIPYSYTVPITGTNLQVSEITEHSIAVTWESDSDVSTEWTAVCSGDNGYADTQVTTQCAAVFEGTEVGVTYTIAVNNATMTVPMLLTVENSLCQISSFEATPDGSAMHLAWEPTGREIPETWTLRYGPASMEELEQTEVSGNSTDLTGLIPGASYVFTLEDPSGRSLGGTYEITAETPEAVLYEDHDFGGIFIGLYEKPDIVWDVQYLGEVKETFAVGTPIICVIQPTATPQVQETPEEIEVRLIIRDSDGNPVCAGEPETYSWNDMWQNGVFAAAIDETPDTAGTYKMELYFNNELLRTAEFTME